MKRILKKTLSISSLIMIFPFCSCSSEYDLDKLDSKVEIMSEKVIIPIGSTDSIRIADFIDDMDMEILQKNSDGEYSFMQTDEIDFSENMPDMSDLKMDAQHIVQEVSAQFPDVKEDFTISSMSIQQSSALSFGDISLSDLQMPDISVDRELALDPGIDLPSIPGVSLPVSQNFTFNGTVPVSMPSYTLPSEISEIRTVYLTPDSKITLHFSKINMDKMDILLSTFKIRFPEVMNIEGADANHTVTISGESILNSGYEKSFTVNSLDFTHADMPSGQIVLNEEIGYDIEVNISGEVSSLDTPSTWSLKMSFSSDLTVDNSDVVIRDIQIPLPEGIEDVQDIELSGLTESYGTIYVVPSGNPTMNILLEMPQIPGLDLKTDEQGIRINLPDFMQMTDIPSSCTYDPTTSTVTLKGNVPENLILGIEKLAIDPVLIGNSYYVHSEFSLEGGLILSGGNLNSDQLVNLNSQKMTVNASIPEIVPETVSISTLSYDFEKDFLLKLSVSDGLEYISYINNITFKDALLDFNLKMMEPYLELGTDLELDVDVVFPDVFLFDDERVVEKEIDGEVKKVLSFKDYLSSDKNLGVQDIVVSGFEINREIEDILEIEEVVKVLVNVKADNPILDADASNILNLEVNVDMPESHLEMFDGTVNFEMDPVEEEVVMGELPEVLKGEDVVLDIMNPVLKVNIKSNITLPINGVLSIVPYIDNQPVENASIEGLNLTLPAANPDLDITETQFWIGPKDGMPEGYIWIEADLAKLIRKFPDKIKIKFEAEVDNTVRHLLDFSDPFTASMEYLLEAPLKFGENFNIPIETKVDSLPDQIMSIMTDILEAQSAIHLVARATSNIPLDLDLMLETLDLKGNPTPVKAGPVTIKACDPNGKPVSSEFVLSLEAKGIEDLPVIAALLIKFNAHSAGAAVSDIGITDETFIRLELGLRIEGGIVIDLDEYMGLAGEE